MRVLVVGAGPTGLTAAVELARRGIETLVIDRRDKGSTFSRAVGITPRSLRLLEPSGVSGGLLAEGMKVREVRGYRGAELMLSLTVTVSKPRYGFDFILALAQDRTELILHDKFVELGGTVSYGTQLTGLRQSGRQVVTETSDGQETRFDYVIGADGIGSTTRQLLGMEFPGFDLPETWSIADVDADDWGHAKAFTLCQLRGGDVAVVVPLEAGRYRVISSTEDALAALPLAMSVTNIRRQGTFTISIRQVAKYRKGRVFLAGDAAHCHSPVGGRGMNLGIADGVDLARRMAERDLGGYSAARHEDGAKTIAMSERARKVLTSSNPLTRALVLGLFKLVSVTPALQRQFAKAMLYG